MNEQSNATGRSGLFARIIAGLFDKPAIPTGLIVLIVTLILTQAAALLMNQPAAYWMNPRSATDVPFGFLLPIGPLFHLILFILYAGLVGLLLSRLKVAAGLPLAAALLFVHTTGLSWGMICGFVPLYQPHTVAGCDAYNNALFVLVPLVFILILLGARLPERFQRWGKRILISFTVLWTLLMGYGILRAAYPPRSPWSPLAPAHSPGPRNMATVAYDTKRHRAVLFGGLTLWNGEKWVYDSSTWEWDGQDWAQIDTPVAPTGRILHAMAYDEAREKVILYGGENESGKLADLWEWDGLTWHRLCPVCNPAARYGHKMIFNPDQQEIMLYGGQDGKVSFGEGWTWNGQSWTYFPFDESAPGLCYDPLIYDSANKRAVSFIGGGWGGTWIWEGSNWQKLNLAVQPPIRDESIMVYDSLQNHSILFGGVNNTGFLFGDTWMFDGETWTQIDTPSAPPQRSDAVAFYDPVRKSIILYGGTKFHSNYGDMWEFVLPEGEQQ